MTELLSPAGSMQAMKAAVNAGADAVYFAGKKYGARARAENFENNELETAIDFCHVRGVKTYIAVNTAIKQNEISDALRLAEKLYILGADALIVSDLGLAQLLHQHLPDFPLHASTQTTARSAGDVNFLRSCGFSRVILARETPFPLIKDICARTKTEVEVFIHGALCACYSGKCLMSAMIGERSGNRGTCAQPCRKLYTLTEDEKPIKKGYLLSPKDLCGAAYANDLREIGVAALKIEGRMKNPEYVYQSTVFYHNLLDGKKPDEQAYSDLKQVFGRGGMTKGYFSSHSSPDMISLFSSTPNGTLVGRVNEFDDVTFRCSFTTLETLFPGDGLLIDGKAGVYVNKKTLPGEVYEFKIYSLVNSVNSVAINPNAPVYRTFAKNLSDKLKQAIVNDSAKIDVSCKIIARLGEPLFVEIYHKPSDTRVTAQSSQPLRKPENAPITTEILEKRMAKTGGTIFNITEFDTEIEAVFIPVSILNDLRRQVLAEAETAIAQKSRRAHDLKIKVSLKNPSPNIPMSAKKWHASVLNEEQFHALLQIDKIRRIYVPIEWAETAKQSAPTKEIFGILPFDGAKPENLEANIDGFSACSFAQLATLKRLGKKAASNFGFNVFNEFTLNFLQKYAETVHLSHELTFTEINSFADAHSEITIYGKTLLMTTRLCPIGLHKAAKSPQKFCAERNTPSIFALKDTADASFPIITNCAACLAQIYNDRPILMSTKMRDINNCPVGAVNLSFTDESAAETLEIALAHINEAPLDLPKFTYGKFYHGVEP